MKYDKDERIVMTLDAGGTNFVFSAIRANKEIITPITLPSNAHDLHSCLSTVSDGFTKVKEKIPRKPVAISFAFPGPAYYPNGIIGEPQNFPSFKGQGGIALGPMLKERFKLPVFSNNDGNLYAYGEAIAGFLPFINNLLEEAGSPKRYKNLLGITLGTGFGGGIVHDGQLFLGDNSTDAEICLLRNKLEPRFHAEESVSARGIKRYYASNAGIDIEDSPGPKEISEIASGKAKGNKEAAVLAYRMMGEVLGDVLANTITLIDAMVVIGGGISRAYSLFLPSVIKEMNGKFETASGGSIPRMFVKAYNLEDSNDMDLFINGELKEISVLGTDKKIRYDPLKRIGVGITKLGTSNAASLGAYAFALNKLDSSYRKT